MNALQQIRKSGFTIVLLNSNTLTVSPASKLSDKQRAFLKANKPEIIKELHTENKKVRVYKYRLVDYPNETPTLITPGYDFEKARQTLFKKFGKERVLEVIDSSSSRRWVGLVTKPG